MKQALVMVTDAWDAAEGQIAGCERVGGEGWRVTFSPVAAVVGRNGLGWGRGVHETVWAAAGEPVKREGDGRGPAGVFPLLAVFGASPGVPPGVRMPYQPCTPHLRWVDDPESLFYNRPVEAVPGEDEGWRSAEVMARPDGLYRLGVVVGHNTQAIEPGAGSCIFIHVWKGPLGGTAGCTALALEPLERLVGWLDPQAGPVLVQLPRPVLHRTETLSALARSCSQL